VLGFPPLPSEARPVRFVVLCEADKFTDGLWSAWSWMRFLQSDVQLHLFVDGAISPDQRQAFARLFPGAELSELGEFLAGQAPPSPAFQVFLDGYRYARKLSLILHLQRSTPVLYCDSDVLAFRSPRLLLEIVRRVDRGAYMVDPASRRDKTYVDPWIQARARELSLPCLEELNSGLLWIPQGSLRAELVEQLLTGWSPAVYYHFAEQTILAVLLGVNGAQALPEAEYTLSAQGMHFWERDLPCRDLTVRHYVGLVRHRMYSHAYPYLLRQQRMDRAPDAAP
jgi:hypothetical protein